MKIKSKKQRKKANFMFRINVLEQLSALIPSGERSDFVNEAVVEKLNRESRVALFEEMDKYTPPESKKVTIEQILKSIHEGRRY